MLQIFNQNNGLQVKLHENVETCKITQLLYARSDSHEVVPNDSVNEIRNFSITCLALNMHHLIIA